MAAQHVLEFRVRYSEVDPMGSYYNSRVLEWFEYGRNELVRSLGVPYREMEDRGIRLPVTEAQVRFLGRAQYDDRLRMTSTLSMAGRARLKIEAEIQHADTAAPVCRGWTVHAVLDASGRPIRPPQWLVALIETPRE